MSELALPKPAFVYNRIQIDVDRYCCRGHAGMKYLMLIISGFAVLAAGLLLVAWLMANAGAESRPAEQWHAESWMQEDKTLPADLPDRILCLTDLPPLEPVRTAESFPAAIRKSREVGCNGAVLSHSWPSLETGAGELTLNELKGAVVANEG